VRRVPARPVNSRGGGLTTSQGKALPHTSPQIQNLHHRSALALYLVLQHHQRMNELLGTRRATGNEHIHRDHLVYRNQRVIVEHAGRRGAGAHRDHPFRFRHLLVQVADHWGHFIGNAPGDDHQVRLPRRATKNLRPEARDIEARCAHGHHFDGAARQAERHGPDGVLTRPVDGLVKRRQNESFRCRRPLCEFVVDARK